MSDANAAGGGGGASSSSAFEMLEREQAGQAPGGVAERARAGQPGPDPQELGQFLDALDHYQPTVRAFDACMSCGS